MFLVYSHALKWFNALEIYGVSVGHLEVLIAKVKDFYNKDVTTCNKNERILNNLTSKKIKWRTLREIFLAGSFMLQL